MNERVYQGIIGVMFVSLLGTYYQIYTKDDSSTESIVKRPQVDMSKMKSRYVHVDSKELIQKQQEQNNMKKIRLHSAISDLESSTSKSMRMIQDYNSKHPNNKRALQETAYDFDTARVNLNLSQIKQKYSAVKSQTNYNTPSRTSSSTKSSSDSSPSTDSSSSSNSYSSGGGSYGASYSSSMNSSTSSSSTVVASADTQVLELQETILTSAPKPNEKVLAYQDSIAEMTSTIENINNNLN